MDWFKVHSAGILRGSLAGSSHTIQIVWIKLLAIVNESRTRDGWLHFAPGQPMPHEFIATNCRVSVQELEEALQAFQNDKDNGGRPRIEITPDGDIYLKNWEQYQGKPARVVAKELGIESAKRSRRTKNIADMSLLRAVNQLNVNLLATTKVNRANKESDL